MEAALLPGTSQTPSVICVVINWQGWRDTLNCIESLLAQEYKPMQIVVVDSASADDSVSRIRAAFPSIDVLCATANRGFGASANLGIRAALDHGAEFVWLLNNDIVAPSDTLTKLVEAATDPAIGMVGSVLYYLHDPGKVQAWGGGSIRRWMGYVSHFHEPASLNHNSFLTFASILLRREMLEQIGLLDDNYFMYFEDSDLSFRARAAGWRLTVAASTNVLHKEGGSSGEKKKKNPLLDRIVTASGLRFLGRYGRPRALAQMLFVLSRLGKRAAHGNIAGIRAVFRGIRDWRRGTPLAFQEEP